ncbi:DUF4255 domain-containing protein [Shimia sp. R10_1]|uniref:Pvc16 family protein n=1 Tax=Shimia sp. R10_1 TaxID=2821095 RepID=UPI001ADBBAEE|nr:Pvc16 family protein [Shimia sp. R10_1]MBO9474737.1 DUF4255 domain-containing protein [Shimia sp. R10_1]
MATPESSLSVALQELAEFIAGQMADDVIVSVDVPNRVSKAAEDSDKHHLNLFTYRLAPSGIHADQSMQEPFFVRAQVLVTAFPAGKGNPPADADLRVLGQAMRVLSSVPVLPVVLPGALPVDAEPEDFRAAQTTQYRLQVVFQAPTMEELNHIWTTQGGELPYRLSAAYELALIPIEPLVHAAPPEPVQAVELLSGVGTQAAPFQMFVSAGRLFSHLEVAAATATADLRVVGQPETRIGVTVEWVRAGGATQRQPEQTFTVATTDIDSGAAGISVALTGASAGDRAVLYTQPLNADDTPLSEKVYANLLQLTVGA